MDVVCLKYGDKFNSFHVNRLYKMVKRNLQCDFKFICYTEDTNGIDRDIVVQPLPDYLLETWWWKLTLFENPTKVPTIFLDLDVVIQNDITHFKNYCIDDMLCLVKAYWKPYMSKKVEEFDVDINSSIMIWNGDCTDIWNKFAYNMDYYMIKYKGIDRYLYYDQPDKLLYLPEGEAYSRLYGTNKYNYNLYGHGIKRLFFRPDIPVCIFDGHNSGINKPFDDEGYNGFEKYWN